MPLLLERPEEPAASGHDASRPRDGASRFRSVLTRHVLALGLVTMIAGFALANSAFATLPNLRNIAVASSVVAVIAVPSALLIMAGHVDLSVGSSLALGAMTAGQLMTTGDLPIWVGAAAGILVCSAVGVVNGWLCSVRGYSPIVVTLGMLTVVRGLALSIEPNTVFGLPVAFTRLGQSAFLGIPTLAWVAAVTFVSGHVFLEKTRRGKHLQATGLDPRAAFAIGLPVRALPFAAYVVTGLSVGVAAMMFLARVGSVTPGVTGSALELDVLTAVLLGGVAFGGGRRGSILDVFLGVAFLGVLQNGLTILNAPFGVALLAKGLALVLAAAFDRIRYPSTT